MQSNKRIDLDIQLQFYKQYQFGRETWHNEGSSEGPHAKQHSVPKREPWK